MTFITTEEATPSLLSSSSSPGTIESPHSLQSICWWEFCSVKVWKNGYWISTQDFPPSPTLLHLVISLNTFWMLLPLERLLHISKAGVLWGLCSTLPCGDLISQDFNKLICVLICLNFLVSYKLPSGKVYLYPFTLSYPWHIANTWKMVFKKFLNEWILATSFLSFLLWFGCICLSKGSWAETVIFSGEVWRERKFYEVWPRGESTHHYLFGRLSPLSHFSTI